MTWTLWFQLLGIIIVLGVVVNTVIVDVREKWKK